MERDDRNRADAGEEKVSPVESWLYNGQGDWIPQTQWVIEERPVTLFVNEREIVTLLCAGHHLQELAVGFSYAEGFLDSTDDLVSVQVEANTGRVHLQVQSDTALSETLLHKRTLASGCGKGTLFYHALDALLAQPVESPIRVPAHALCQHVRKLNDLSQTYKRTHGVHNCALADCREILVFRDDIGRHNAVDMLVGHALLHRMPLEDKLLITTGRLTSEIIIKAAKVGLPVVVSRNTATTLAIALAHQLNITLIGYARAGKFTLYTGKERLS
ncbi:FdhD protein [Desulfacinum hydrothermale DSM 13146]|uniref:Sulfur carrier protein FdhD n=1 Tax=Desulfacinum hydrothermale DSM 13146 TaxID=1121390 RepID=A0A1W1XJE8_9BACT|nr:formate dehydrogenase accessory sulfurtransferase FdhD [Desulfacinum hydrothermale]SMC23942.1 FdhD protein [Desulfacinum hydrothermale DSM 13146]